MVRKELVHVVIVGDVRGLVILVEKARQQQQQHYFHSSCTLIDTLWSMTLTWRKNDVG